MRILSLAVALSSAAFVASGASAAPAPASTVVLNGDCVGDIGSPTVLGCIGYYDKNLLNEAGITQQKSALAQIGFSPVTFDFNSYAKIPSLNGSFTVDFGKTLYGLTYLGLHFGNGSAPGNATAFYKIDAGSLGVRTITLLEKASSGAVLYSTGNAPPIKVNAVPEPATWAMMLGGFAVMGLAARRRRGVAGAAAA